MQDLWRTAGYCGLSCKACSVYIASSLGGGALEKRAKQAGIAPEELYCKGCRSDKTSSYCTDCRIKQCAKEKGLSWCSECREYPCSQIQDFQASMPHRAGTFGSLEYARTHTIEEWDRETELHFSCTNCGVYNSIYEDTCRNCGETPPNVFAKKYEQRIQRWKQQKQ